MYAAVLAEPTNEMASMSGESSIALTTSTEPFTRLMTPGGRPPTSSMISHISACVIGTCSEGFST